MFERSFKHVFRRAICMPKCTDEQLQYEAESISNKLSRQEMICEDAKPTYSRSIASLATH